MYGCSWETQPFRKPKGYYMLESKKEKDRLFFFSICFHQTSTTNTWRKMKKKRRTERCVCGSELWNRLNQYLYSGLHSFVTRVLGHPASPSVLHRLRANSWHVTFIQAKHPYTFFKKQKKHVIFLKTVTGSFYSWRWVWMEAPCGLWLGRGSQRPVQMWSREECWRLRKDEGSRH